MLTEQYLNVIKYAMLTWNDSFIISHTRQFMSITVNGRNWKSNLLIKEPMASWHKIRIAAAAISIETDCVHDWHYTF